MAESAGSIERRASHRRTSINWHSSEMMVNVAETAKAGTIMTAEREVALTHVVERLESQLLLLDELKEHVAAAQLQYVIDHLNGKIGGLKA